MSLLDRIHACNNGGDLDAYLPFMVEGVRVGWVHREFAPALVRFPDIFAIGEEAVTLSPGLDGYQARTRAVDAPLRALDRDGWFSGWRDEPYPVATGFHDPAFFEMERTAVQRFGVSAYGVHVNGFVRDGDRLSLWIGRRADDKPTYPGQLDNMVAGGQPVGLGLMENVIKEAGEEAAVPPDLAATARPVGAITYLHEDAGGLKPDCVFVYDLELPADFTPRNTDGELAGFELMPAGDVMAICADSADFKFNCSVVNIDFFIRHGLIGPEHPDYLSLLRGMRR
jgi:8-oxo-dGTP pyrophosphatase MutT (NUDIX family)